MTSSKLCDDASNAEQSPEVTVHRQCSRDDRQQLEERQNGEFGSKSTAEQSDPMGLVQIRLSGIDVLGCSCIVGQGSTALDPEQCGMTSKDERESEQSPRQQPLKPTGSSTENAR